MSQEGRGCLVGDQVGSDKGRGSGSAVPPLDPRMQLFTEGLETKWDLSFINLYIVQTLYRKQR